jgi:hypothetical protein
MDEEAGDAVSDQGAIKLRGVDGGRFIMYAYRIMEHEPVGILDFCPTPYIYMRNLHLIKKSRLAEANAADPGRGVTAD